MILSLKKEKKTPHSFHDKGIHFNDSIRCKSN